MIFLSQETIIRLGVVAGLVSILFSCGAPQDTNLDKEKSADSNLALAQKEKQLCKNLAEQTSSPRLSETPWDLSECQSGAGLIDLNKLSDLLQVAPALFSATSIPPSSPTSAGFLILNMRSRLVLGRDLLQIIDLMSIDETTPKAPSTSDTPSKPKMVDVQVTDTISFDVQSGILSGKLILNSTRSNNGYVSIKNPVTIHGQYFDDAKGFGITAISDAPQPEEQSLFRMIKVVAIVVPHAGDVFVDLGIELELYSYNADAVMQKVFLTSLTDALKSLVVYLRPDLAQQSEVP